MECLYELYISISVAKLQQIRLMTKLLIIINDKMFWFLLLLHTVTIKANDLS